MSKVPAQFVKRGAWLNVDDGPVMGRVITTDTQTGNIIIAILAVMTTFGTTHLWNLVSFASHQIRSQSNTPDGLHHQQQALLRTLPTPSSFLTDWIRIGWAWRRKQSRALIRSLPHVLLGVMFTAMAVVVGIFASYIVTSTNTPVLIKSSACGWPVSSLSSDSINLLQDPEGKIQTSSRAYARQCYQASSNSPQPEICNTFIQSRVPFTRERVKCPIDPSFCAKIDRPALSMDSGPIDVNDGLGMNLPNEHRVQFRKKTQCALIDLTGRWSFVNISHPFYLARPQKPGDKVYGLHLANLTLPGVEHMSFYSPMTTTNMSGQFSVRSIQRYHSPLLSELNDFVPLPGLEMDNGDSFHLTVAKNTVIYLAQVDDPLFAAHQPWQVQLVQGQRTAYVSDFPFSSIWCHLQYQFCFNRKNKPNFCTTLDGLPGNVSIETFPDTSELQRSVVMHIVQSSIFFDIGLTSESLLVSDQVGMSGFHPGMPSDQWVQEIIAWEDHTWAAHQVAASERAIEFRDESNQTTLWRTNMTSEQKQMCSMQRMRNPGGFVNINVFGLAFTITLCSLVTIVDIVLLKFLIFLTRFRKALAPRIDSWIQDSVYQVQRRAFELQGQGVWERTEKDIPTTVEMTKLVHLPLDSVPVSSVDGLPEHVCKCQNLPTPVISATLPSPPSPTSTTTSTLNQTLTVNSMPTSNSMATQGGAHSTTGGGGVDPVISATSDLPAIAQANDEIEPQRADVPPQNNPPSSVIDATENTTA